MRIGYDSQTDAIVLSFSGGAEERSQEVAPGLIVTWDAGGKIVALELLRSHWPIALETFSQVTIDMPRRLHPQADEKGVS